MRKKRFLSVILSAAMIVGSSVTAFAWPTDSDITVRGSVSGNARVEGWLDKDVFSVDVPTVPNRGNGSVRPADFILDPQGLIEATSGNKYTSSNSTYNKGITGVSNNEWGSMYFATLLSDNTTLLSTNSDPFTITNKGAVSINVALKASIANAGDIVISTNRSTLSSNTTPSMYLELDTVNGTDTDSIAISASETSLDSTVDTTRSAYAVSYNNTNDTYEYKVPSSNSANYASVSFNLTGACNENADWSDLVNASPEVNIAWEITPVGYEYEAPPTPAAPSIQTTEVTLSRNQPATFAVDLGVGVLAATGVDSVLNADASDKALGSEFWSYSGGTLTITETMVNNLINNANLQERNLKVVFNDDNATTIDICLKK